MERNEGAYRQLHKEVAAEGLVETALNTASQATSAGRGFPGAGPPRGGASQQPGLHLREHTGQWEGGGDGEGASEVAPLAKGSILCS